LWGHSHFHARIIKLVGRGELHEQRGQAEEAREAFSLAAQTLRMLAGNIGDAKLREGFLSAARVRRVLTHN
jgi:hypothetical protein